MPIKPIRTALLSYGMSGEVFRSAGDAPELQFLAAAVCLRPQHGGPEAGIEQNPGTQR